MRKKRKRLKPQTQIWSQTQSFKLHGATTTFYHRSKMQAKSHRHQTRLLEKAYKSNTNLIIQNLWEKLYRMQFLINLRRKSSWALLVFKMKIWLNYGKTQLIKCNKAYKVKKMIKYSDFYCLISTNLCHNYFRAQKSVKNTKISSLDF